MAGTANRCPGSRRRPSSRVATSPSIIKARIGGRLPPAPFRYRHSGSLATIGRKAAVADFGWLRLSGALAWWVWGVVHILFLSGLRNRVVVALEWFWAYLTYHPSTRLITGELPITERSIPAPLTAGYVPQGKATTEPSLPVPSTSD